MIAFLYKVAVHMVEIPEDEDEKEVERDHYNWQLVSPFNTLVTVLIEAIGLVTGDLAKNAVISGLKKECFTMDISLLLSLLNRYNLVINDHCEVSEDASFQSLAQPAESVQVPAQTPVQPAVQPVAQAPAQPVGDLLGMPAQSVDDLLGMPAPQPSTVDDLLGMPAPQPSTVDDLLGMPAPQPSAVDDLLGMPVTQPSAVDDLLGGVAPAAQSVASVNMFSGMAASPEGVLCSSQPIEEAYKPLYNEAIQVAKQLKLLISSKDFPLDDIVYLSRLNDGLRTLLSEVGVVWRCDV